MIARCRLVRMPVCPDALPYDNVPSRILPVVVARSGQRQIRSTGGAQKACVRFLEREFQGVGQLGHSGSRSPFTALAVFPAAGSEVFDPRTVRGSFMTSSINPRLCSVRDRSRREPQRWSRTLGSLQPRICQGVASGCTVRRDAP
jgi:hypothetical protein